MKAFLICFHCLFKSPFEEFRTELEFFSYLWHKIFDHNRVRELKKKFNEEAGSRNVDKVFS